MKTDIFLEWYKNKVVLVTGGTSGIGLEMVKLLARAGVKVFFCGRDQKAIDRVSSETQAEGFCVDLSKHEDVGKLISALHFKCPINVLINNAGLGGIESFSKADLQDLQIMQSVNMGAVVILCRELLSQVSSKPGGGILNVGSVASFFPTPGSAVYGATKFFVAGFTDALHEELRPVGVNVTGLYPGNTYSRFLTRATRGKMSDWDKAMPSEKVAEAGLRGLAQNKIRIIPGITNKIMVFIARVLPVEFLLLLTGVRSPKVKAL